MRYLVWVLRLAIFIVVLMFALKNTGPVTVNFFQDHLVADVPLIVVMLVVFILGAVLGLLIALPTILRKRREIGRLKREVVTLQDQLRLGKAPQDVMTSELIAPLAPL